MTYAPHTDEDRQAMLAALGLSSVEELFRDIPEEVRLRRPLDIPPGESEAALRRRLGAMARRNASADRYVCFLGGGVYDHYIPAAIPPLLSRGEFLTAYTPYQPEVSQGTLQSILEFQTMICALTGMDVANASMYDGASAAAEAALMAVDMAGRDRLLAPRTVAPDVRETVRTYLSGRGYALDEVEVDPAAGRLDPERLADALTDRHAAVIVGYPNFFGVVEDLAALAAVAHERGALLIAACDPIALGIFESPGALGADIVVGDGQALGNPMNFGGPSFGFFAAREAFLRRMPGRIAGRTVDRDGTPGCVLTLQTREQHIRRARATSNICTNNALNALAATIYLSLLGPAGLREVAAACLQNAHYAAERLEAAGARLAYRAPFFKEFLLELPCPPEDVIRRGLERGILAGRSLRREYPELDRHLLVAVTEQRTREEIEALAGIVEEAIR
ncbi:MAG: aminomethyl-transferring glycine dehydrogenase subunit GcvPA [Firmicutes bacterium]|nr:aminomethyl-transferring glycine dehydrogenase subunit GcvPA [Bacillota bacterium]